MTSDFINVSQTRNLQNDSKVILANWKTLQRFGAYNILKVQARSPEVQRVKGYITLLPAISGATPKQMEDILGLRAGQLAGGADIYRLSRVPNKGEFNVRGYTTLVDGLRLKQGLRTDRAGYRPGHGAYQIDLKVEIPAQRIVQLSPGQIFNPGTHPKYRQP